MYVQDAIVLYVEIRPPPPNSTLLYNTLICPPPPNSTLSYNTLIRPPPLNSTPSTAAASVTTPYTTLLTNITLIKQRICPYKKQSAAVHPKVMLCFNLDQVQPSVIAKANALAEKAGNTAFCGEAVEETTRDQWGTVVENICKCTCPRGENCKDFSKNAGVIQFPAKKGFTNPYKHLLACHFKGKMDEEVVSCYWVAKVYQQEQIQSKKMNSFCTKKPKQHCAPVECKGH